MAGREVQRGLGPVHVACAADQAYLPHAAAMLHSLLVRHPDARVHFLHGPEISVAQLHPLAGMVQSLGGIWQSHYLPPEKVAGLPRLSQIPAIMWYRIYLPELLPDVDRVLYLDCDTLVMDDLTPLWETDLEDAYLGAVSNVMEEHARDWPRQLGMPDGQPYFNSGVLLLNLKTLRRDGMAEKLAAFGRDRAAHLRWPDQDALNVLLGGKHVDLHPRWNCQNSLFYYAYSRDLFGDTAVEAAVREPGILHFEGGHVVKPWHYLSKHPLRAAYFTHRSATPWPEVDIEGATAFNRLLRLLPMRWMIPVMKFNYRFKNRMARLWRR